MFRVWRRDYREHVIWPPDYVRTGTWWFPFLLLVFERLSKFYQNKLSKPLPKNLIRPPLSTPSHDHHGTYPFVVEFYVQVNLSCLYLGLYITARKAIFVHGKLPVYLVPEQSISALSLALLKFMVSVLGFTCAPRSACEVVLKK